MTLREICLECGINIPLTHERGPLKEKWVMTVTKVYSDGDFFIVVALTSDGVTIFKEDQYNPVDNFTIFRGEIN